MYYEVAVVFTEEIQTKSGIREKKSYKELFSRVLSMLQQKARFLSTYLQVRFIGKLKAVKAI